MRLFARAALGLVAVAALSLAGCSNCCKPKCSPCAKPCSPCAKPCSPCGAPAAPAPMPMPTPDTKPAAVQVAPAVEAK